MGNFAFHFGPQPFQVFGCELPGFSVSVLSSWSFLVFRHFLSLVDRFTCLVPYFAVIKVMPGRLCASESEELIYMLRATGL